jgi:hypothetical protein
MIETANDAYLLAADAAIGVWIDLEEALACKNGFGGDVAEIYAYRLVHDGVKSFTTKDAAVRGKLAEIAGAHLTHIAERFTVKRKATIALEEFVDGHWIFRPLDLLIESLPPFDWRVHLRVTPSGATGDGLDEATLFMLLKPEDLRHPGFEAFHQQLSRRGSVQTAIKSAWEAFQAGWDAQ